MGSPESELCRRPEEGPQHRVRITKPYYLGMFHVTRGQFTRFLDWPDDIPHGRRRRASPDVWLYERAWPDNQADNAWQDPGFVQTHEHPVVNVSWDQAVVFCDWLSKNEGKRYWLPTEAQWEYACRAGTMTPFAFGCVLDGWEANCDGNHPYGTEERGLYVGGTTAVGRIRPMPLACTTCTGMPGSGARIRLRGITMRNHR